MMAESPVDFAGQLLAGLDGTFESLEPQLDSLAAENRNYRLGWGIVEVSHGIIPVSAFRSSWPEYNIEDALRNPELTALVEEIGSRPDIQTLGQQKLTTKTMQAALGLVATRLEASDCGIHHARDAADLAIKINSALSKSGKPEPMQRMRSVRIFNRIATVQSPEFPYGFDLEIKSNGSALKLFRAMRCIEPDEFRDVWSVLKTSLFSGSITLEGW
jgi:hypothetical protein